MAIHCFGGCKGFTRIVILGVNVFFLGAGLLIIILASVALGKAQQFEDQSSIFTYMATAVSSAILVATGVGTVVTAILGFLGAVFKWTTWLKIYTIIMFLTCTLQLSIGIFLYTRDINKQCEDYWFDPTPDGVPTRAAYQNYLDCCGWASTYDTRTDAWGPTDCPTGFQPGWELGYPGAWPPCYDATKTWVKKYINPISVAAIVLAVFQFVALFGSCFIIMSEGKDVDDFTANPYHY